MPILPRRIGRRLNRIHLRTPPGSRPGEIVVEKEAPKPVIRVIAYGPDDVTEQTIDRLEQLDDYLGHWPVVWVNVDGLGDAELLKRIAERFNLHRLALEDVVNVYQRPKVEAYEDQLFIVTRMFTLEPRIEAEQISMFLGPGYVLTFQEHAGDCFDLVRTRIREGRGRIRQAGNDYLAYALLDALVDAYFPVLERYGEHIEDLEQRTMHDVSESLVGEIHTTRQELLALRRFAWSQREALSALVRSENKLIADETRLYLRDCYDHAIQILDMSETYRELASGLMDLYLSSVSNRMNEIMKVLTIFAAIFIPLGFLAGLYGMNFNPDVSPFNMPETQARYGYPLALLSMLVVAGGLLLYFWRKGWIGRRNT